MLFSTGASFLLDSSSSCDCFSRETIKTIRSNDTIWIFYMFNNEHFSDLSILWSQLCLNLFAGIGKYSFIYRTVLCKNLINSLKWCHMNFLDLCGYPQVNITHQILWQKCQYSRGFVGNESFTRQVKCIELSTSPVLLH